MSVGARDAWGRRGGNGSGSGRNTTPDISKSNKETGAAEIEQNTKPEKDRFSKPARLWDRGKRGGPRGGRSRIASRKRFTKFKDGKKQRAARKGLRCVRQTQKKKEALWRGGQPQKRFPSPKKQYLTRKVFNRQSRTTGKKGGVHRPIWGKEQSFVSEIKKTSRAPFLFGRGNQKGTGKKRDKRQRKMRHTRAMIKSRYPTHSPLEMAKVRKSQEERKDRASGN